MSSFDRFSYETDFLYSLLLTVTVESIVIYALLFYFYKEKRGLKNILLAGVLPSFATLPYLWFIFPILFIGNHTLYVVIGELSVTLVEGFILQGVLQIGFKRAFILSIVANFCSYFVGIFY